MTSIKFRALTHDDHKLFFEALGEYGKDFQNIQQYMAQKGGKSTNKSSEQNKSNDPQERREQDKKEDDKKREQIRNFYNKLYTKLSQLIDYKLDDRVEKVNQELYLLINYGEIWKKHGFKFNDKTKKLLKELVNQGYTTYRSKNKNVRLRTPPCKALKKINEIGIDEKVKVVTARELPKDVVVELHPATNRDWLKVQSMSQNPRVRAKLSIQKRLSNILEFLENKWNISQDKLNRTVDVWLKVQPSNQNIEDLQMQRNLPANNLSGNSGNHNSELRQQDSANNPGLDNQNRPISGGNVHYRLRLKPSAQHELKEVNITRVIPDNHLDLSLKAYINRLGESKSKNCEQTSKSDKDSSNNINCSNNISEEMNNLGGQVELSQGVVSTSSRLPVSLTTPDSSILLERSCTSDQPSIAQARKHLNLLQSLTGSLENCENSRTVCEDTQDRSLLNLLHPENNHSEGFGYQHVESNPSQTSPIILVNNNIPALYDEDAALPIPSAQETPIIEQSDYSISNQPNSDSQNSKSVDFHIPKNVTLGEYFKMAGGDEANDAFPVVDNGITNTEAVEYDIDVEAKKGLEEPCQRAQVKESIINSAGNNNNNLMRPHNHMIEIKKLAEGWTRQDESSMTIGELYLAFKCPEKIILEYEFEQFAYDDSQSNENNTEYSKTNSSNVPSTKKIQESPSNNILIFKLLTAASLSLAHIERQKQERQHKLHDQQSCSKLKRRKGPGQGHAMTLHDIETTNQRVEEALKQLQPTRLSSYRRAR